jgi:hypothetical protein
MPRAPIAEIIPNRAHLLLVAQACVPIGSAELQRDSARDRANRSSPSTSIPTLQSAARFQHVLLATPCGLMDQDFLVMETMNRDRVITQTGSLGKDRFHQPVIQQNDLRLMVAVLFAKRFKTIALLSQILGGHRITFRRQLARRAQQLSRVGEVVNAPEAAYARTAT